MARRLELTGRTVVGCVVHRDGPDVEALVEAIAIAVRERDDVAALFVGDESALGGLGGAVRRFGLTRIVRHVGGISAAELPAYYAASDVVVVPDHREDGALDASLTALQAMAMERVPLVADTPALLETIGRGDRGASFRARSRSDLAASLLHLLDDPPERSSLARAARCWVTVERSWEVNGRRYREAYDRIGVRVS